NLHRNPVAAPVAFPASIRPMRLPGNGWLATRFIQGSILIAGQRLGLVTGSHNGTIGTVSQGFPAQFGLIGVPLAAQSVATPASLGFSVRLSSAVESTIGTF